jgi:hypothetical protein
MIFFSVSFRTRWFLSRAPLFCFASFYDPFTARSTHTQQTGDWDAMDAFSFILSHMRILVTFYVCIIGTGGGLFGFHKTRGISWLAEDLLASQEGLCFMELVS